jgi:hypothetical protein
MQYSSRMLNADGVRVFWGSGGAKGAFLLKRLAAKLQGHSCTFLVLLLLLRLH